MNEEEFMEYIQRKPCYCMLCFKLRLAILEEGLEALDNYKGMVCSGIQDLMLRRPERNVK